MNERVKNKNMKNTNCDLCSQSEEFSNWDSTEYEYPEIIEHRLGLVSQAKC